MQRTLLRRLGAETRMLRGKCMMKFRSLKRKMKRNKPRQIVLIQIIIVAGIIIESEWMIVGQDVRQKREHGG
jgi:hypothetical protein